MNLLELAQKKGKTLLVESFSYTPKLTEVIKFDKQELVEAKGNAFKALAVLKNVPTTKFTINLNDRIYPRPLWQLVSDSGKAEGTLCLADHPEDEGSITRIAGVWNNFRVLDDHCVCDLYLVGQYGQLILEVILAGGSVGFSSVGFGELGMDGKTVNPDSYELCRVGDAVIDPSQQVFATLENIEESQGGSPKSQNILEENQNIESQDTNKILSDIDSRNSDQNEGRPAIMDKLQEANFRNQVQVRLKEAKKNPNKIEALNDLKELRAIVPVELTEEIQKIDFAAQSLSESFEKQVETKDAQLATLKEQHKIAGEVLSRNKARLEKMDGVIAKLQEDSKDKSQLLENQKGMLADIKQFQEDRKAMLEDIKVAKSIHARLQAKLKESQKERQDMLADIKVFQEERKYMLNDIKVLKEMLRKSKSLLEGEDSPAEDEEESGIEDELVSEMDDEAEDGMEDGEEEMPIEEADDETETSDDDEDDSEDEEEPIEESDYTEVGGMDDEDEEVSPGFAENFGMGDEEDQDGLDANMLEGDYEVEDPEADDEEMSMEEEGEEPLLTGADDEEDDEDAPAMASESAYFEAFRQTLNKGFTAAKNNFREALNRKTTGKKPTAKAKPQAQPAKSNNSLVEGFYKQEVKKYPSLVGVKKQILASKSLQEAVKKVELFKNNDERILRTSKKGADMKESTSSKSGQAADASWLGDRD